MIRPGLLALTLLLIPGAAGAQIEKVATLTTSGVELQWWPKVPPPRGWHFDSGSSHRFRFNAMAPDGSTFANAETVMYAQAQYKPRVAKIKSLAQLVREDVSDFHQAYPGMQVTVESPVFTADHKQLRVMTFTPSAGGNWERVAYGEAAEFYVLFTVSSRTKNGLDLAMPAFRAMVASYRVEP